MGRKVECYYIGKVPIYWEEILAHEVFRMETVRLKKSEGVTFSGTGLRFSNVSFLQCFKGNEHLMVSVPPEMNATDVRLKRSTPCSPCQQERHA